MSLHSYREFFVCLMIVYYALLGEKVLPVSFVTFTREIVCRQGT